MSHQQLHNIQRRTAGGISVLRMRNRLDLLESTEVLLYFSENTDMRKLEKELLEIYGPGKSKSDIHSLYENSINRVKRTEPYMFQIEENVQNDLSYIIQDGNPFQDALDDPDYMLKHWVTENGLSIISEEVVEYFKSLEDDEIP